MISLGGIIGSCYFLGAGYAIEQAGPAIILSYLFGGIIVLCVMLCLAELAVAEPISGSFVSYAKKNISSTWACGVGWAYWLNWMAYVPSEMIAAGIIMNNFVPEVSQLWWAIFFGLIVTIINLFEVDNFGESEFWLSMIKVVALVVFCIVAGLIVLGLIGDQGYLGASVLLSQGGFAPHGYWPIVLTMVIILVNFQGTEIIGLAAGECKDPAKSIPIAVRNVSWRVIALYIIPITLLLSILPWNKASLNESVFAAALAEYGLDGMASVIAFVVLVAGVSCANSGLYGGARALHALANMGMAPAFLGKLNKNGMPQNSIIISVCACWLVIVMYTFNQDSAIYTYLLAVSGFTGAMAWISICWSQYNFRKHLIAQGLEHTLKYKTPFFPYVTCFGIWSQIFCLAVIVLTPDLRETLYAGVPMLVLPMIWYKWRQHHNNSKIPVAVASIHKQ